MKSLYKLFIALSFLGLAACGSDSDECSPCSVDNDCDEGLYCGAAYGDDPYCFSVTGDTICVNTY